MEFSVEDDAEIKDETTLLTFSETLFQVQGTAAEGERQREKERKRPRHCTGNSSWTLHWHALKRRKIVGTNQTFISSWIKKDPEAVEDVMRADQANSVSSNTVLCKSETKTHV